jgi:hypothetical protein
MTKPTDTDAKAANKISTPATRGGTLDQPKGAGQATTRGGGPDSAKGADDEKGGGPDKSKDAQANSKKSAASHSKRKKTGGTPVLR